MSIRLKTSEQLAQLLVMPAKERFLQPDNPVVRVKNGAGYGMGVKVVAIVSITNARGWPETIHAHSYQSIKDLLAAHAAGKKLYFDHTGDHHTIKSSD